jgi:hypothetical protein
VPEGPLSATSGDIRVYVNQLDARTYEMQSLGTASVQLITEERGIALRTATIDRARAVCGGEFDILAGGDTSFLKPTIPGPMRVRCR